MSRPCVVLVFLLAGVCVPLGAGPRTGPDRLLRDGYAAYQRGDLSLAAALYDRAEERTTDPALLAFNLAGVQYRQALVTGEMRLLAEAEQNYRCCLGPADPRRTAALYGLGCCLVARAGGRDVAVLTEAVEVYENCLREPDLPADLAAAARYNQEVTRFKLLRARAALASSPDNPPNGSESDPKLPDRRSAPENHSAEPGERTPGNPMTVGEPDPAQGDDARNARETKEPPLPGKSTLPPIPQDDQATPLSPRDAAAHLEQAADRIRGERQRTLKAKATNAPALGVRDW